MRNEVFHSDKNSADLVRLINDRRMIVFVGSGLSSITGGYPSWWHLVDKLCKACKVQGHPEISKSTSSEDLQILAGKARESNEKAYVQTIEQEFARTVVTTTRAYHLLMRAPFRSYLTTNYDPLLALEMEHHEQDNFKLHAFPEFHHFALEQGGVFYLHGYVPEGGRVDLNRLVLTKADFDAAYSEDQNELSILWALLLQKCPILFIGCRLGEPEIELLFSRCNAVRRARYERFRIQPRPRFILLPFQHTVTSEFNERISLEEQLRLEEEQLRLEEERFKELDIRIVRYDPIDADHSGLIEILEEWAPSPKIDIFKEQQLDYSFHEGEI